WPDLQTHEIGAIYILPLSNEAGVNYYLTGLASSDLLDRRSMAMAQARLCIKALGVSVAIYRKLTVSETLLQEMQRDVFVDPLTNVMNRAGWANSLLSLE